MLSVQGAMSVGSFTTKPNPSSLLYPNTIQMFSHREIQWQTMHTRKTSNAVVQSLDMDGILGE